VRNKWSNEESLQYNREYQQECERLLGPDCFKSKLEDTQHWRETGETSTRSLQLKQWEVQYFRRVAKSLGDLSMRYKFTISLAHPLKNSYIMWYTQSCGCGCGCCCCCRRCCRCCRRRCLLAQKVSQYQQHYKKQYYAVPSGLVFREGLGLCNFDDDDDDDDDENED